MFTISAHKLGMAVPIKMLRFPFFFNNHPCGDVKLKLSPAQLLMRLLTIYTNATTVNYTTRRRLC